MQAEAFISIRDARPEAEVSQSSHMNVIKSIANCAYPISPKYNGTKHFEVKK